MEKWKCIPGTGDRLLVSDQGRVKSLLRDGRILKAVSDKKGYLRLRVTLDREKKSYKIHRLVAEAFIPNPNGKEQVNHINGDKTDNRAENLEWVTNRENASHAIRAGLWDSVIAGSAKENNSRKKGVIASNGEICMLFESVSEAERYFGSRHIVDVLKGKRTHVKGWAFSYAEGGDQDANADH